MFFYARGEMALPVMISLGSYNNTAIIITASLGFVLSIIANYLFGLVLLKIYNAATDSEIQKNYKTAREVFSRYGNFLLCMNIFPIICWPLPLFAGFLTHGICRAILFAGSSRLIYYCYLVYL